MLIANLIDSCNLYEILEKKFHEHHLAKFPALNQFTHFIKFHPLIDKVKEVARSVLNATISAFFYWVNPSLFAIGFITGIIIDDKVRYAIQKIKSVWKNQTLKGCLIGTFACGLSLPVTLATATLLWSADFGSLMHSSEDETNQTSPAT